ncbi:hypothetical protein XCCB1459_4110 [Xanthomonas campestris pv. campestris]|nr:hypothetical protein XCCB1459_4110 [Xanthomonas campestris pv. campestris]
MHAALMDGYRFSAPEHLEISRDRRNLATVKQAQLVPCTSSPAGTTALRS